MTGFEKIPEGMVIFASAVMLLIGVIECFAGFKISKLMTAVWGFFMGTFIGVAIGLANRSVIAGVILALLFGMVLAVLSYKLYSAGLFVLVGSLSGLMLYLFTKSAVAAVIAGIAAGVLAVLFVKPVVIISTAASGSAILAVSACVMMGIRSYTGIPALYVLWILLTVAGIACQFITTSSKLRRRLAGQKKYTSSNTLTFSERKYPGMQRAYRNFCINCGCALTADDKSCPRCRFKIEDE